MKILSIAFQGNHDANITYFDGKKSHYLNLERIKGVKKYWPGRQDLPKISEDLLGMNIPLRLDAIVTNFNNAVDLTKNSDIELGEEWYYPEGEYIREITEEQYFCFFQSLAYRAEKYYRCEHHYAHYMNAEWLYNNTQKGIVIDGCGDEGIHLSVFKDRYRIKALTILDTPSIGGMYYQTAADMLENHNEPIPNNSWRDLSGNFMGLISYGNFNEKYANYLRQFDFEDFLVQAHNPASYFPQAGLTMSERFMTHGNAISDDRRSSSAAAKYPMSVVHEMPSKIIYQWELDYFKTVQVILAEKIIQFIKRYFKPDEEFIYTGGVAHNVVINAELSKAFPKMKIPPSIGDEGLSLGTMYTLLEKLNIQDKGDCPITNWQQEYIPLMSDNTVVASAEALVQGKIVCVCQGESHIGPRALGNRSILYLPNREYAAHYFNDRGIKNREWWRPYGVIILEEELQNYLQTTTLSPWMLHVAEPTDLGKKAMSGVIHTDNTVRYQTVKDGPYAKLLKKLKAMGQPPIVINTSLNEHGKPIAHTVGDVKSFVELNWVDAVVIGEDISFNLQQLYDDKA